MSGHLVRLCLAPGQHLQQRHGGWGGARPSFLKQEAVGAWWWRVCPALHDEVRTPSHSPQSPAAPAHSPDLLSPHILTTLPFMRNPKKGLCPCGGPCAWHTLSLKPHLCFRPRCNDNTVYTPLILLPPRTGFMPPVPSSPGLMGGSTSPAWTRGLESSCCKVG